jgi:uncharacterized protein YecE (DUF72 family)
MPLTRLDRVSTFVERVDALGSRLGPVRIVVEAARDEGLLAFLRGSLPPELEVAYDFRHESWNGVDGLVRVNDFDAEPFRYIRLREPPYSDDDLRELASRLRAPAYVYFRHEDAPTAPEYATRLLALTQAPSNE